MQAELLLDAKAVLGEGPSWEEKSQTLYWVDILQKRIHAWKDGRDEFLQLDEFTGCVVPRRNGGLVAALKSSIWTLDMTGGKQAQLAAVRETEDNRFNDGKCDPAGRLLAGTMNLDESSPTGNLYSLEAGKQPRKLLDGIRISNGLAWSPDHRVFHYIDTPTRQVRAFDYDLETGNISNPRVAVEVPESMGWPDGMTSDMEGKLWIALWGGSRVTRWDPASGRLEAEIPIPAPHVSSCVFGGERRDILYITTARKGMSEAELAANPLAGGLFQVQTQTEGMPTFAFAG